MRMESTIKIGESGRGGHTTSASRTSRCLFAVAILIGCIAFDQATKRAATELLLGEPPRMYLGGMVRLEYALNSGGVPERRQ